MAGACIDVPEIQQVTEDTDAGHVEPADAATPDAGAPSLEVGLVTPRTATNGALDVRVEVNGPVPDLVELLVDGERVATLLPPYRMQWETQVLAEGQYELHARATLGSKVFLSAPHPLTVDRSPPSWVSRTPSTGAPFVLVGQVVQAVFSEPLDPTTVHSNSIRMFGGADVIAADVSLSADGTTVTVSPLSRPPLDVLVKVTFGNSVTDVAGNPVPAGEEWSWSLPGFLPLGDFLFTESRTNTSSFYEALRLDSAGRPVVAWLDEQRNGVYVRRWTGETWELLGAGLRTASPAQSPSSVALALDANDEPVVAWSEDLGSVVYVHRWNGAGWEAMGAAIPSPLSPWGVSLGRNAAGQWHLGFASGRYEGSQLLVWRWESDHWAQLGAALKVVPTASMIGSRMEFRGAQGPLVTWSEWAGVDNQRGHMRRWQEGGWHAIPLASQNPGGAWGLDVLERPLNLVASGDGVRLRAWDEMDWVQLGTPMAGRFAGATQVAALGLALDPAGNPVAMLGEAEVSEQTETYYVRRLRDGAWEDWGGLLRPLPDGARSRRALFAVTPSGRVLMVRAETTAPNVQPIRVYISNE
ncbi:Ig-like domain-containing protein [Myxococcus sp. CA039A]|uniref:Ig-like domain-containing protein n=1 Tax=Myxococcus sp. CA039A TaxID=2741737 RepID=UPI00157A2F1F|nr:Ig-like domain-containing protein [Myxococcus sp. CA039A]NTX56706.1 Ig-like domain-containing protein [Myxococcus sp. CA039A]